MSCRHAFLLAAGLFATTASAKSQQDFNLVNSTGYTINEVYVAPTKSDDWEEDVMGRDVLDNGESVKIEFSRDENVCHYDLKVVFAEGDSAEWSDFNLCKVSKIKIRYNRKTGDTTAEYE